MVKLLWPVRREPVLRTGGAPAGRSQKGCPPWPTSSRSKPCATTPPTALLRRVARLPGESLVLRQDPFQELLLLPRQLLLLAQQVVDQSRGHLVQRLAVSLPGLL